MNFDNVRQVRWVVLGFLWLNGVTGSDRVGKTTPSPALALTVESHVETPSTKTPGSLVMTYVLANQGATDLHLGPLSTSCGCSAATVRPEIIPAGGKAVVSVEGIPPTSGAKSVSISVPTSDLDQPTLTLHWNLASQALPPALLTPPPTINLGIVRPGRIPLSQSFSFEILKNRDAPPFIQGVVGAPESSQIEGGVVDEMITDDSQFSSRSYRYTIRFQNAWPAGEIAGQIQLRSATGAAKPWMTIPIRGTVLPIVRAIPAVVSVPSRLGDIQPAARVMILCDDQSGTLEVECVAHDPTITVQRVKQESDRMIFEVKHDGTGAGDVLQSLDFRVNQPITTNLLVPIRLSIENRGFGS